MGKRVRIYIESKYSRNIINEGKKIEKKCQQQYDAVSLTYKFSKFTHYVWSRPYFDTGTMETDTNTLNLCFRQLQTIYSVT